MNLKLEKSLILNFRFPIHKRFREVHQRNEIEQNQILRLIWIIEQNREKNVGHWLSFMDACFCHVTALAYSCNKKIKIIKLVSSFNEVHQHRYRISVASSTVVNSTFINIGAFHWLLSELIVFVFRVINFD